MPYIHVVLDDDRPEEQKRSLMRGITEEVVRVLDSKKDDVFVFISAISNDNLSVGGEKPETFRTINTTIVIAQGRPIEVRMRLITALTDVIEYHLQAKREDIHVVISEQNHENIGEGGIPMNLPQLPAWYSSKQGKV